MELSEEPRTKDARYREIAAILARHGFGIVEEQFLKSEPDLDQARAQHLREACEELGTVFIKLGQMLSTRGDLLPDAYRMELAKLEDSVPPLPASVIADVIREDLGASPQELFTFFDPAPIGSASIGQVHWARLQDGRDVVLKVRKPGVEKLVEIDLQILSDLVNSWSPRFPALEQLDARGIVREFSDMLRAELDYRREASNENLFREAFDGEPGFHIPEVIASFSTERVLTHERIDGVKASDAVAIPPERRVAVSRLIARFLLEPAFERGVFYADPHAGNLLIRQDGSLGVIDFGMVGRLTPESRRRVADLFIAIRRCNPERLTDRLIELTAPTHPMDRALVVNDVNRLLERYVDVAFESVRLGDALGELLQLLRRYRIRLPANVAQLFKALAMCEGILQAIDPHSSISDYLQPMASKMLYGAVAGDGLAERLRDSAMDAAELSIELPRRIDRVLGEIERGNLRVWARVEGVDPLLKRVEHIAERANVTMLASAFVIALSIIMQFYHPQGWRQWIGAVFWVAVAGVAINCVRTLIGLRK